MRRSNLIILVVALAMGTIAAFMARSWIARHTTDQPASIAGTILVAAAPLVFGTVLTEDNVSEIAWNERLPEGAFAKKLDLFKEGRRVVLAAMDRSEIILRPKVTGPGQRASLSVLLEEGQRAVTVRVDDIRGVAGFILPGDRVDVVLLRTETRQGGETENSAEVLLDFVKVLAIDQLLNERADQPTVATVAKAVTLQVTTEQAQKVLLAGNIGKLSLILRQPGEGRVSQGRQITDDDLGPGFARREVVKASAPAAPQVDARRDNTKVSIYHGTDLKSYEVVRENID